MNSQGIDKRVKTSEKSILNSVADVNQLVPFKYPWAWQAYLKSSENHWMPTETQLTGLRIDDLSPEHKEVLNRFLSELVTRNADDYCVEDVFDHSANVLFMYRHNTAPECRQYLLRQGFEDAIAQHAYQWITESIGYTNHRPYNVVMPSHLHPAETFSTDSIGSIEYYICFVLENVVLMKGIAPLQTYVDVLKIPHKGLHDIATKVIRDRMNHIDFALKVINQIFDENPKASRDSVEINKVLADWEDSLFTSSSYVKAQMAEYRSMIQPMSHPYRHPPLGTFNSGLEIPAIKQWLATDHVVSEQPTTMSGLDWD